jgi:hypothetical protein
MQKSCETIVFVIGKLWSCRPLRHCLEQRDGMFVQQIHKFENGPSRLTAGRPSPSHDAGTIRHANPPPPGMYAPRAVWSSHGTRASDRQDISHG